MDRLFGPKVEVIPPNQQRGLVRARARVPSYNFGGPPTASVGAFGVSRTKGYLEALTTTDTRSDIPLYTKEVRAMVRSLSRAQMANLSRYLQQNDALVRYAFGMIIGNCTPVIPLGDTPDDVWNMEANAYFTDQMDHLDFTGRFTYRTLQQMMVRGFLTDGDCAQRATNQNGFCQFQVIHGEHIGDPLLRPIDTKDQDGVIVDRFGIVTGYRVAVGRTLIPVSANEMKLFGEFEFFDDYRCISPLAAGSNDTRDIKDIKHFMKVRSKIGAALGMVLKGNGEIEEDTWGDDTGPEGTDPTLVANEGTAATQQQRKTTLAEILGGEIQQLPEGLELQQIDTKNPNANELELLNTLAAHYVMALEIPAAFYLDEKLTSPNARSVQGKAQSRFDRMVEVVCETVLWQWTRVISDGINRGKLRPNPDFAKIQYQCPRKLSIDAGRDSKNEREDQARGLMSRRMHFGNRNENWRSETDQIFAEDRYIIGKVKTEAADLKVDEKMMLIRWGFGLNQPPQPDQQATDGNNSNSGSGSEGETKK